MSAPFYWAPFYWAVRAQKYAVKNAGLKLERVRQIHIDSRSLRDGVRP